MRKTLSWTAFLTTGLFMSGALQAQSTFTLAGSTYSLKLPYLEFGSGSAKKAYAIKLASSDLSTFTLDLASVGSVTTQTASASSPTLNQSGTSFNLTVPSLEVAGTGQTYAAQFTSSDLMQWTLVPSSVATVATSNTLTAPTNVAVAATSSQTVGSYTFGSSTKLAVSWTAPTAYSADHYEVIATEATMGTRATKTVAAGTTSTTLSDLKAATSYSVVVKACKDSTCSQYGAASAVTGTTANEYWQMQGSGSSISGLTQLVSDGNARMSITRIGSDAGTANAGKLQLYYGPSGTNGYSTLAVAVGNAAASASTASSYQTFTSKTGSSGLVSPTGYTGSSSSSSTSSTSLKYVSTVLTGQGVPLSSALGAKMRVFFEGTGSDGKTRIFSVDSKDGYLGLDFNSGSAATCSTEADYASGGGCEPTLAIGVAGDSTGANAKISNARQNKVGYPTQTDWRWDGAAGTFMVFTTDSVSGCSSYSMNHGYAVWDGSQWNVQYRDNGCPKLFASAQACLPMHLGGTRYKMYCGDPSQTTGKVTSSGLPWVGPKKLIYADGGNSGADATVDFEDWESLSNSRDVYFLWPDGTKLDDKAEGYIDDYHFLAPTGSLDLQVAYVTITDSNVSPFPVAAILLNP